jgi:transcriptional regulator with XRE-family HTH domain
VVYRKKNLKIACIKKGIKIYELARELEVTPDYLSKVIIGIKKLSDKKKNKASSILGEDKEYLFKEE